MEMYIPESVEINEVVLRDGIQNDKKIVPTDDKVRSS